MFFQLAWRNIWRNPRRTLVIMTAVIIGVWSMIFLGALSRGMIEGMIENGISTLTGHIQIHKRGFRNDPAINNSMEAGSIIEHTLTTTLPQDAHYAKRIRVNAVADNARHSAGVTLVGIEPEMEKRVSFIGQAVIAGRYLKPADKRGIIIGQALMDKFETKIGHKLVLMSQDTQNDIASKSFTIVGVFRAEMEATEKRFVFVSFAAATQMLKLDDGISEFAVSLSKRGAEDELTTVLNRRLGGFGVVAESWKELIPFLRAYLDMFDEFMYIWYLVVFTAMGFGIVNTTLMAVYERMREFGLLKALGMRPFWIVRGVLTESLFLLLIGAGVGNLLGFIFVYLTAQTGIDLSALSAGAEMWGMTRIIYPVVALQDVFVANFTVVILGLLVSAYPAFKAARFTPVEAMAQN